MVVVGVVEGGREGGAECTDEEEDELKPDRARGGGFAVESVFGEDGGEPLDDVVIVVGLLPPVVTVILETLEVLFVSARARAFISKRYTSIWLWTI